MVSFYRLVFKFFLLVILFIKVAEAKDGPYFGGDLIYMDANFKYFDKDNQLDNVPIGKFDDQAVGLSGFMGYKKNSYLFFFSPEIFYDYLNLSTKDYYKISDNLANNRIELRSRLGIKVNFGYDFSEKFSLYATYGYVSLNYINRYPAIDKSEGMSKLSDIYGFGIIYNLDEHWSIKSEFNRQISNLRYRINGPTASSELKLNTIKTGIVFNF